MANADLLGMPLELLVHIIATYLSTKELGALRMTCKHLDKSLFDTFAKEFFTKKQFMLSTHSLGVLLAISQHAQFSSYVNHLIIGLDNYELADGIPSTDEKREKYRDGWADQFALKSTGRDRDMLAEAIRHLPNLKTLGIRDYAATGRERDGNRYESRWRSYGAPTIQRETDCALNVATSTDATRVFQLLLQAQVEAGKSIPTMEVLLRRYGVGLNDIAFFVPPTDTRLKAVLEGLQVLLLSLSSDQVLERRCSIMVTANSDGRVPMTPLLIDFLSHTNGLQHLRLNFTQNHYGLVPWIFKSLNQATSILPNLHKLDLGKLDVDPDLLLSLIYRFAPTLKHLHLWRIGLTHNTAPRWKDSEDRYHPWPQVISRLHTSKLPNLQLKSLTLGLAFHISPMAPHLDLLFLEAGSEKRVVTCEGDMKEEIPKLVSAMHVKWPPNLPDVGSENEDEDEDEYENEDEEDEEEDEEMTV